MIIINVAKSGLSKGALKNTCKWRTLRGQAMGAVDIDKRVAWERRTIPNNIKGIEDGGPIPGLVSIFSP